MFKRAPSVAMLFVPLGASAQTDTTKLNTLNFSLNAMTHGEIIRGGLPIDEDEIIEDLTNFLIAVTYTMMFSTQTMNRLKQGNTDKKTRWG